MHQSVGGGIALRLVLEMVKIHLAASSIVIDDEALRAQRLLRKPSSANPGITL